MDKMSTEPTSEIQVKAKTTLQIMLMAFSMGISLNRPNISIHGKDDKCGFGDGDELWVEMTKMPYYSTPPTTQLDKLKFA